MDWQLSNCLVDKYVIDMAYHIIVENDKEPTNKNEHNSDLCYVTTTSSKYYMKFVINENTIQTQVYWKINKDRTSNILSDELQSFYNKFGDAIFDQEIEGFTKLKKGGILCRSDKTI